MKMTKTLLDDKSVPSITEYMGKKILKTGQVIPSKC